MPTSCKSNKENKLTPEDLVGILQKKYRNSGNLPDYDEVTPELLSRIEKLRPQIDKALTKLQSYTFWEHFNILKQNVLYQLNGGLVGGLMAFALSRDVDLNDPKVLDAIDVYSAGLDSQVLLDMIKSKDIREAMTHLSAHERKGQSTLIYSTECSVEIGYKERRQIKNTIDSYLEHLLMWGPTVENFSSDETILRRLFNGVATVSLSSVSAHGLQNVFPFASYMHDLFHYENCHEDVVGSLAQFTFEKVLQDIPRGKEIKLLIKEHSKEAIRLFDVLFKELSEFHELAVAANDRRTLAGLFYIFHEGNIGGMQAADWNHYNNLPELLNRLVSRSKFIKTVDGIDNGVDSVAWNSCLDPFITNPQTGEIQARDEELIQVAKSKIEEFKKVVEARKQHHEIQTKSSLKALEKAEKQVSLVSIELKRTKRFVKAIVHKTFSFESEHISLCTTLYHKRRNAWDLFWILGQSAGTGMPKPDTLTNSVETMAYLKELYEVKLTHALKHTVAASHHRYQIAPRNRLRIQGPLPIQNGFQTFQGAYQRAKDREKEELGYGNGAIVVYNHCTPRNFGI
ncbi:MAG: hypothetical protein HOI53_02980 [Francisellaceae bacterium]|nr:hypothetical protein [Francisellaceae bacterium]